MRGPGNGLHGSDAQMNTEERACYRMMKNQCGQMDMPASHGLLPESP
jgi:hypothetical protein